MGPVDMNMKVIDTEVFETSLGKLPGNTYLVIPAVVAGFPFVIREPLFDLFQGVIAQKGKDGWIGQVNNAGSENAGLYLGAAAACGGTRNMQAAVKTAMKRFKAVADLNFLQIGNKVFQPF